jgi:hypothetical protein
MTSRNKKIADALSKMTERTVKWLSRVGVGRLTRDRLAHMGSRRRMGGQSARGMRRRLANTRACGLRPMRARVGFGRSDVACAPLAQWINRLAGLGDGLMNNIYIYIYNQNC